MLNIIKDMKHRNKIRKHTNEYVKRLNDAIDRLEKCRVQLLKGFLNNYIDFDTFNKSVVQVNNMLNDLYDTKDYINKNGTVIEHHSCVWFMEI